MPPRSLSTYTVLHKLYNRSVTGHLYRWFALLSISTTAPKTTIQPLVGSKKNLKPASSAIFVRNNNQKEPFK